MRIVIYDTNKPSSSAKYDLEDLKKSLKNQKMINLMRYKTNATGVNRFDNENILGFVENISIYKGVFRGDLVLKEGKEKEYSPLIEEHLRNNRLHIAMRVDGFKKGDIIEVLKIKEIFYLYLN